MPLRCGGWESFLKAIIELDEIPARVDVRWSGNLNSDFSVEYLAISYLPYTRKIGSSAGGEKLVYVSIILAFLILLRFSHNLKC